MPTISPSHPRHDYKFSGIPIKVPHPFASGHTLSTGEAHFLNRQLASYVGNGYSGEIRRELKKIDDERAAAFKAKTYTGPLTEPDAKGKQFPAPATPTDLSWDHQAEFDAKFDGYVLGESNRGSGETSTKDPVAQFAHTIASAKVKELIKAKGLKVTQFTASSTNNDQGVSKFGQLVAQYIAANSWVEELAKSQVEAMNAASGVDLDVIAPEAAAAE